MHVSSILWLLSLPVFIYVCYLLVRAALRLLDRK